MKRQVVAVAAIGGLGIGVAAATAAGAFGAQPASRASALAQQGLAHAPAHGNGTPVQGSGATVPGHGIAAGSGGAPNPSSTAAGRSSSSAAPLAGRSTSQSATAPVARSTTVPGPRSTPATAPSKKPTSRYSGPSSPATASTHAPLLIAGAYAGRAPRQIDFSVDEGNIVTHLTWTTWSSSRAVGIGRSDADSCVPNCAVAPVQIEATTVVLSAPADGHYSAITEVRGGRTERFTYPSVWPVGAAPSTPAPAPTGTQTGPPTSTQTSTQTGGGSGTTRSSSAAAAASSSSSSPLSSMAHAEGARTAAIEFSGTGSGHLADAVTNYPVPGGKATTSVSATPDGSPC